MNKRLKAIASLIDTNSIIIDVGCDHAHLPIHLVKNNICNKAYASDINKNALESAIYNINKNNLNKAVETIINDGINILPSDVNVIVIAGMGGIRIIDILESNKHKLDSISSIIIEPNNNLEFVRRNLCKINFYIENEILVKDKGKIYTIIKLKKGNRKYSNKEIKFGPILIRQKDELFKENISNQIKEYKNIYKNMPKKNVLKKISILYNILIRKTLLK